MSEGSEFPRPDSASKAERQVFRIPLGRLGWFASLLLSLAAGLLAFCATCFAAIFAVLFYNSMGHQVDFAVTYKYAALPAGLAVLAACLVYLGALWTRRVFGAKRLSA